MKEALAPVHFWMYYKIQVMQKLVELVTSLNATNNWYAGDLKQEVTLEYGEVPIGDLKELIDLDNIHQWIENYVDVVEGSLAFAITKILNEDSDYLNEIKHEFFDYGAKNFNIRGINVANNYEKLNSIILNGMPCDKAIEVTSSSFSRVEFKEVVNVHDKYWQAVSGDVKNYYELIIAFINGIFSQGSSVIKKIDERTFEIVKEPKSE